MKHSHMWLLSCAVFIAISTTNCHGSAHDPEYEVTSTKPFSYTSSLSSSLREVFTTFIGNFSTLIKKSCSSGAKYRFIPEDRQPHQQLFALGMFGHRERHLYTQSLFPSPFHEIKKELFIQRKPLVSIAKRTETNASIELLEEIVSSEDLLEKLRKSLKKSQRKNRTFEYDSEMNDLEESTFSPKDAFDVLQAKHEEATAEINALKKEHKEEISVLKHTFAEKELFYLQEIHFLKEQLNTVLKANFVMPSDFDADVYLALHPHVKRYTQENKMSEEEAQVYAKIHYGEVAGPLHNAPYKEDSTSLSPESAFISSSREMIPICAIDELPEDLKIFLLENPQVIIAAVTNGYDLEEYTRLYMKTVSSDQV